MKILVIDDFETVRNEICDFFKMENYEVYYASNGLEGLAMVMKYMPDVVISDLMMPILSGLQFYKFLKKNPKIKNIPVILFTGNTDEMQKKLALKLGIRHYFIKPISYEFMLETVKSVAIN